MNTALLVGATGLVGGHLLELLLQAPGYGRVEVLARRPLGREHPKLRAHVVDFTRLDALTDGVQVADVFCALGTTIARAGSQDAFRQVDHDHVLAVARWARARGAAQFLLVSALGAAAGSRVFYNRVKGETEADLQRLGYPALVMVRPSLLLGERAEFRAGERVAEAVLRPLRPLMRGPLRAYRPIPARAVAAAMLRLAQERRPGVRVVENAELQRLGTLHSGG